MPMQRHLYPKDWEAIARSLKESANWICQDCGRPCRRPGESQADLIDRIYADPYWRESLYEIVEDEELGPVAVPKTGRFTLTVAHLNHRPEDCRPENLKVLCSVCHCRMDIAPSAMAAKRAIALERQGQLNLLDLLQ